MQYTDLLISLLPILCEADRRSVRIYLKDENLSEYNYDLLIRYHITPDNILSKILTSPHPGSVEQIPYREICTYELFRLHAEEFQQRLVDRNYIFHSDNPDAYQNDERNFVVARLSMSLEVMRAYLESPFIQEFMTQFQ
jgi:hypothetical protein